jgi:hypothetical protein
MKEKLAQAGEGRRCMPLLLPTPFHYIYNQVQVEVYAPAEWADPLLLFLLYPYMYRYSVDVKSRIRHGAFGIGIGNVLSPIAPRQFLAV